MMMMMISHSSNSNYDHNVCLKELHIIPFHLGLYHLLAYDVYITHGLISWSNFYRSLTCTFSFCLPFPQQHANINKPWCSIQQVSSHPYTTSSYVFCWLIFNINFFIHALSYTHHSSSNGSWGVHISCKSFPFSTPLTFSRFHIMNFHIPVYIISLE